MDVLCLSHLRWDFVFQRPQQVLSRAARDRRVFFFEEPIYAEGPPMLIERTTAEGVRVCVPRLPPGLSPGVALDVQRAMIGRLRLAQGIDAPLLWVYSPMMFPIARDISPGLVVYDCMDELSAFRFAPPEMVERETALIAAADLVFTGGQSLYEAKRSRHPRVHCFPSSIDADFFGRARRPGQEPVGMRGIGRPRLGFMGVIDERLDLVLLDAVAALRPSWQILLLGPTVKIDPATIPSRPNVHRLGGQPYQDLPAWLSSWDVGLMPFARNESTRFISPTKTPEYLAAGLPVVSTPILDVVRTWGQTVHIAADAWSFVDACEAALAERRSGDVARRDRADQQLATGSWDRTWTAMDAEISALVAVVAS